MRMRKIVLVWIPTLVLLVTETLAGVKLPDWAAELPEQVPEPLRTRDRIVLRCVTADFDPERDRLLLRERQAWQVGGAERYSSFSAVDYFAGEGNFKAERALLLTPDGELERLPKNTLRNKPVYGSYTLYSDSRAAEWTLPHVETGSLVLLDYEITLENCPRMIRLPLQSAFEPVQEIRLDLVAPESWTVTAATSVGTSFAVNDGMLVLQDLPVWSSEPYDGGFSNSAVFVEIEIRQAGQRYRWNDVAKEMLTRWKDVYSVHPAETSAGREVIDQILRDFEAQYRYVSVQIGEGRFVPHRLKDIERVQYGDCKDLTLVLLSELQRRGVDAHPVLTNLPWNRPFRDDVPSSNQFNHVIVGWIENGDTLYHDATSRKRTPGRTPMPLAGAPALWLTPDGDLTRIPNVEEPYTIQLSLAGGFRPTGQFEGTISITPDPRLDEVDYADWLELEPETISGLLHEDLNVLSVSQSEPTDSGKIAAEIVLANWVQPIQSSWLLHVCPFESGEHALPVERTAGYYFLDHPLVWDYHVNAILPAEVSRRVETGDTLNLDVGLSRSSVNIRGDSLVGSWRFGNRLRKVSAGQRAQLDSLLTTWNQIRDARQLIEFKQ